MSLDVDQSLLEWCQLFFFTLFTFPYDSLYCCAGEWILAWAHFRSLPISIVYWRLASTLPGRTPRLVLHNPFNSLFHHLLAGMSQITLFNQCKTGKRNMSARNFLKSDPKTDVIRCYWRLSILLESSLTSLVLCKVRQIVEEFKISLVDWFRVGQKQVLFSWGSWLSAVL